jgi:FMN phosphatase YigB (HAD superfamily)
VRVAAVVFDIGGVLLDWDPRHLYRSVFASQAEMEHFLSEVCTLEWHAAHDRGVAYAENAAPLIAAHPEHAAAIRAWSERSEEMERGEIKGTVRVLGALVAAGVPVYALTNMERDTYERRCRRYPWMSWFRGTVVSSHEGVVKPDPEIFRRLLAHFDLDARTTLLIDDAQRNLDSATALGFQTLHFTDPPALVTALRSRGLPLRDDAESAPR